MEINENVEAINNRYDFVLLFDVKNGNPNGDPDAGNMPRIDPETGLGIVSDVCTKRKIRDYVDLVKGGVDGYDIYMKNGAILNNQHKKAYESLGLKPVNKKLPKDETDAINVTQWMCDNFYDIRAFGAVMTTKVNAGGVRGPVQVAFGTSIDPIIPMEIRITRQSVTDESEADKERTMGSKHIIPYGLYRVHGYVSANLAKKTGFNKSDLEILWEALANMFEHDRSASSGEVTAQALYIFEHSNALGNTSADELFRSVKVEKRADVPRDISDYNIYVAEEDIHPEVTLHSYI